MKLFKTILSLLLVPLLLLQTLPAAVAADTPEDSNQCTVNFVAAGNSEGSETANVDDVITLSSTVSVSPEGWTFCGWTDAELAETTEKPAFYAPGASYTVTANATLYALFTRVEEVAGDMIYQQADDLSVGGKYVITIESYAVGNAVYESANHYVTKQSVTIGSNSGTLTVPSGVDINTVLYEIESGDASNGWVFKNVDNGLYLTLDSSEYVIVGNTPLAWKYSDNNLDNQIDSEGYYYLCLRSDNSAFTTSKSYGNNVILYQEVNPYITYYSTGSVAQQKYTVTCISMGVSAGSTTTYSGDVINLPTSVSNTPDGWEFSGWMETELAETTEAPSFYDPGASFTVTGNATLYALFSHTEEGTVNPVYELVTEAPDDWSGNYVITTNNLNSLYVLTGVTGTSDGTSAENNKNCTAFGISGITLTDNVLYNVADSYVFTLSAQGSCYSIQNVSTGSYYGLNSSSYMYAYSDYKADHCDWTPAINNDHVVQLKNAANGSYPYLGFRNDSSSSRYFWSVTSSNADALYLWKEVKENTVYYSTASVAQQQYTVTCISLGGSAGSTTTYSGDVINLPTSVSNTPDGWEFSGWMETKLAETTEAPSFYNPGASFTVTANATLYALFTRVEEDAGDIIYQQTDDLSVGGKYVIAYDDYAVGNAIPESFKHYVIGQSVTIDSNTGTLTVPSGVDINTVLYEIESGDADHGWVFKNVDNGLYLTLDSSEYVIVGNTPLAWLYDEHDNNCLDNQIDSEGYYYLSWDSSNSRFTTSKSSKNIVLYQEVNSDVTFYSTDPVQSVTLPVFAAHTLTLSGKIGVNYYMDLPAIDGVDYMGSYMTFEISGKGTVSTDPVPYDPTHTYTYENKSYYGFTCYVNSIQMADTITATFHYGDGQTVSEEYSIKQYIESFDTYVEEHPDVYDVETINLVHALADYGHYVQQFLLPVNGWTIGSGDDQYADMDMFYANGYDLNEVKTAVEDYGIQHTMSSDIEVMSYSLRLDSDTAIYLYFKPIADYDGSFTVTVNGNPATVKKQNDGRYLVKIQNIGAHMLGDPYTVVVTTSNGESTVTLSSLSYVYSILNADAYQNNSSAKNGVAAIYHYYAAAAAYKAKHP